MTRREQLRADLAAEHPDFQELPADAQERVLDDVEAMDAGVDDMWTAMERGFERVMAQLDQLHDLFADRRDLTQ